MRIGSSAVQFANDLNQRDVPNKRGKGEIMNLRQSPTLGQ